MDQYKITKSNSMFLLIIALAISIENLVAQEEELAVTNLRAFLRFQTAHPDPTKGYEEAVEWLKGQAEELGLEFHYLDLGEENEFAVWMTWYGSDPTLKSLLLHSHMDVVAADPEKWMYHPYEAHKDEQGDIYGRGTTDMKSYTIGTLEAIRKLKNDEFRPDRNIHVLIMPDEEKLGWRGAKIFVKTKEFQDLNVGVDLDEGDVNPQPDTMRVTIAEKSVWQFNITARGLQAHASTFPEFSAGQRLRKATSKIFEFRQAEYAKLDTPGVTKENLTVVNLAKMGGGIADNSIPNEVWASFDMRIRITPDWNFTDVENMLNNAVEEAKLGDPDDPYNDVFITYISKNLETGETVADDSNIWWTVLQNTCEELEINCPPVVNNAVTDGRFVRDLNIPTFGIAPFLNTPDTAHRVNELINEAEFLAGVQRYATFISNFANTLEPDPESFMVRKFF